MHLLSGLLRCQVCGCGMYGNKSIKNKNGKHYKDYCYYGCKHRRMLQGHSCTFNKQLQEEKLDHAVAEVISRLVSSPKFADIMQKKINMKVDTTEIEKEIANLQKQLGQYIGTKRSLEKQIDNLDIEDRHYDRKLSDLQDRLDKMYDNIDDMENSIAVCRDRIKAIEAEKLTALIDEIQMYEKEQANGQWLKSIAFKLPIIDSDMDLSLDKDSHVETVCFLMRKRINYREEEIGDCGCIYG